MTAAFAHPTLPPGDPAKGSWTYADLAAYFELGQARVKCRMRSWEADGFPAPLPYGYRPKRWRPGAVMAWAKRHETRTGARPVTLELIEGGVHG